MIFNMTGQPEKVLPVRRIEDSKKKKAIKSPWHLKATDKLNKTKPRNFWSVKNSSSLFKRNKSLEPALMALRQCRAAFRVSHLDCLLSCKCLIYISCLTGPRKDSLGARKDLPFTCLKKLFAEVMRCCSESFLLESCQRCSLGVRAAALIHTLQSHWLQ